MELAIMVVLTNVPSTTVAQKVNLAVVHIRYVVMQVRMLYV
ncbi:MAG: hypothetical protein QMB99_00490 [Paludibacteraceae bacterium]